MNHIFISYSRRNEEFVTSIVGRLREEGLSVWQDVSGKASGIPYSTKWFAAIEDALYTASGAVIFRSVEWEKSVPCGKEYELIEKLHIPFFDINLKKKEEVDGSLDDRDALLDNSEIYAAEPNDIDIEVIVQRIVEWAHSDICTGAANENRTWMFSLLSIQKLQKDKNAGIPRFRKRKEALPFLEKLKICEKYVEENGIRENLELYEDTVKLLNRSRFLTKFDLMIRRVVAAVVLFLIAGMGMLAVEIDKKMEKVEKNLEGLSAIEAFHDEIYADEVSALLGMMMEEQEYGDYIYLLFENFADVLDTELPVDFYKSGSDKANAIESLPIQNTLNGYGFEPSENTGVFTVRYENWESDDYEKTITLSLGSVPDAYATDGEYLAIASARQVYVYDLKRGRRLVELRYCYRDVESLRFDEMGRICAITKAGDVYVWDNPIRKLFKENEIMPENAADSSECISADGRFKAVASGDGIIKVVDVKNNCVIYMQSAVTEPVKSIYMDVTSWKIYAEGYSGAVYIIDAGKVLSVYSYDVDEQFENYRRLGDVIIAKMMIELELLRLWWY